jgi:hypothetical protein
VAGLAVGEVLGAGLPLLFEALLVEALLVGALLVGALLVGALLAGALGDGLGDGEVTELGRLTRHPGLVPTAGNAAASPSAM